MQCVAVCCSVLQCVTVCYSVLQCVAVCCSVLQCMADSLLFLVFWFLNVFCNVLQCVAVCSVLQCVAVWICSSKGACFVTAVANQILLYHTCRKSNRTNNLILGTATAALQHTARHCVFHWEVQCSIETKWHEAQNTIANLKVKLSQYQKACTFWIVII